MTEPRFAISANVHSPVVKSVFRLPADHAGVRLLAIDLGDPTGYSHVSLLVTDEQWRAIVRDTDREIVNTDIREADAAAREIQEADAAARELAPKCGECGKVARVDDAGRPSDTVGGQPMCTDCLNDYLAESGADYTADYAIRCPEFVNGCAETFDGDEKLALVTEHMFAEHPEVVAR